MSDPFEQLAEPTEPRLPRPSFRRALRARLVDELDLADTDTTIDLPERKTTMSTTPPTTTPASTTATVVTPYLTVHDANAAIAWYAEAFGAVEQFRVVSDDDGRVGHAELTIGDAHVMLSDEHPEVGVVSPRTLGGTSVALHLQVADVDTTFARAVDGGATSLREPADQPHGSRQGTIIDPYGHRWMLSQPLEAFDVDTYAGRSEDSGYTVVAAADETYRDGIWAVVTYDDPSAGIRFLVDVLGFDEYVFVTDPDDPSVIVHSEFRWPEGGIVQVASWDEGNPFIRPPGEQGLYVVTADPSAVWERCQAAGAEVLRDPYEPHYDGGGMGFSIRDPEGNTWSFGTYAGGATA